MQVKIIMMQTRIGAFMRPEWYPLLSQPLPRYACYPTARAFSDVIGATEFADALAAMPTYATLALNLNIPFCRQLCHHCTCNGEALHDPGRAKRYIQTLIHEIRMVADRTGLLHPITSVHFGGGNPISLDVGDVGRILDSIEQVFGLTDRAEISMEVDPRFVSYDNICEFGALGLSRVNLGVQDFDPDVQRAIGRVQPHAQVAAMVEGLRSCGIFDIGFDLVCGLPHQTSAGFEKTLDETIALEPSRISVLDYGHLPKSLRNQVHGPELSLPSLKSRYELFDLAREMLVHAGYFQIGFDLFARPEDKLTVAARCGTLKRNFQGFSADPAQYSIGLGVSAVSELGELLTKNTNSLSLYEDVIASDNLATAGGIRKTGEDALRATIIEQLLCFLEVDLLSLCNSAQIDLGQFTQAFEDLRELQKLGILTLQDGTVEISDEARALSPVVASSFDTACPSILHSSYAV